MHAHNVSLRTCLDHNMTGCQLQTATCTALHRMHDSRVISTPGPPQSTKPLITAPCLPVTTQHFALSMHACSTVGVDGYLAPSRLVQDPNQSDKGHRIIFTTAGKEVPAWSRQFMHTLSQPDDHEVLLCNELLAITTLPNRQSSQKKSIHGHTILLLLPAVYCKLYPRGVCGRPRAVSGGVPQTLP